MKVATIALVAALLTACHTQEKNTKEVAAGTEDKTQMSTRNCYQYASNGDSVSLYITRAHAGDLVTGTLTYKLKEKDKNEGAVRGSIKNDILLADYLFMSEGQVSTRQVAFKLEGHSLTEGYGEMTERHNKLLFKNPDSLNFDNRIKLLEVVCQ